MNLFDPPDTRKPSILIVDDVPANIGMLLDFLDGAGYEVLVAESGEGALSQLAYVLPDIILLDVTMPGMDGYETCRCLKSEARWRDIPVFFLTALSDPVDKVRGFAVGAVDYITKPLHAEEVLARVRAHLQIRALQRQVEEQNSLLQRAIDLRKEAEDQLQQSLDRAVLVVSRQDGIQFCTRLARRLLDRYFPDDPSDTLPDLLSTWTEGNDRSVPWTYETVDAKLQARLFTDGALDAPFMLLLEETPLLTNTPSRLLVLGLTMREAEVLYWIAHGKTSPEIALILQAALNTIKKHVQNILLKLCVETRLAAALRAAELLGLHAATPADF